jgi:hypothetical protein
MVFIVMPAFDPASASIFPYFVCVIPTFLSAKFQVTKKEKTKVKKTRNRDSKSKENGGAKIIDVKEAPNAKKRQDEFQITPLLGTVVFIAGLIFMCVYVFFCSESNSKFVPTIVLLLMSVIMVSVVWWENFVTSNFTKISNGEKQKSSFLQYYVKSKREKVSALTYLIKIGWTFLATLIIYVIQSKGSSLETARTFLYLDEAATVQTLSETIRLESRSYVTYGCTTSSPYFMALICCILTFVFFKAARYACRVVLQRRCFAPPIVLNLMLMPFVFVSLMKYPLSFTTEGCNVLQPLWELDYMSSVERLWPLIVSGVLGLISVVILTLHVWTTKGSKMDKVERYLSFG